MEWCEILKHLEEMYSFLPNIISSYGPSVKHEKLFPMIKTTAALSLKAIENSTSNRLVVIIPKRLQSAFWVSTICALGIMKNSFVRDAPSFIGYNKGQRLLLNGCTVIYEGTEYNSHLNQRVMFVKCSDGLYGFKLDRKYQILPTDSKALLSKINRVSASYNSAPILYNKLDDILGIKSSEHTSFSDNVVILSKIGEAENFIDQYYISGTKIINLLLWAKLDASGDISILHPGKVSASPSCIVSSDLFRLSSYLNEFPHRTKGVIVDGTGACTNNLQLLDEEILQKNIPCIIIADYLDTVNLYLLKDRGFNFWQWNKEKIAAVSDNLSFSKVSPFYYISQSVSNYCNQRLICNRCDFLEIDSLVKEMMGLEELIDREDKKLIYGIFSLTLDYSRLICSPSNAWIQSFMNKIDKIKQGLVQQKMWLNEDIFIRLEKVIKDLFDIEQVRCKCSNHKIDALGVIINKSSSNIAVIVPKESDVEENSRYWRENISTSMYLRVRFVTSSEIYDCYDQFDEIIVCGWLGKDKMYSLLHSFVLPKITLLLYPFEENWYKNALKRWVKQNNYQLDLKGIKELLSIKSEELIINGDQAGQIPVSDEVPDDVFQLELKINKYMYSNYSISADDSLRAKLIALSQDKISFATESHRLYVLTDLIRGKILQQEIPRKSVNELHVGDYILFLDSDRDIIREIADRGLEAESSLHLRQKSALWKKALMRQYNLVNEDFECFIKILKSSGCERHPSTVRNWLFNDDIIGPGNIGDIQMIAHATRDTLLLENIEEVKKAISKVRSAHLQASVHMQRQLLKRLPKIIEITKDASTQFQRSIIMNLDNFGQISILRIEEISDEWSEIDSKWVNKLITREAD